MENRIKKDPFCSDTINSLTRQDKNSHCYSSCHWFLNNIPKEKKIDWLWTIGLINVGYVPEVFNFKEPISWCAWRFNSRTRMIKVTTKSNNQVVITLKVFKKILRLPSGNKILHLVDAETFLNSQACNSTILRDFFHCLQTCWLNFQRLIYLCYITILGLFMDVWVCGLERVDFTNTRVLALYALYLSFRKDVIFYRA